MKNIFNTIITRMPAEVSVDSFFLSDDLSFISDPLPQIDKSVFYAVFAGLKKNHTLAFEYKSLGDQTSRLRRAQPYHVICQKGNWYMLAYCLKHKEFRMFAFSRMKNPKTTEEHFERPKDFNPKKYFDSEFGVWNTAGAPVKIELLFDEKINTYFLSLIKFATARTKIAVKLVFEIALAMTPSSRYESAVSKFPPMPRLPAFSGLPFMNKFMASPSGILLESTAHIVPIRIASITLHLSKHSAHITQILINTGLVSIFCLFWNFCNYIEFRAKFC